MTYFQRKTILGEVTSTLNCVCEIMFQVKSSSQPLILLIVFSSIKLFTALLYSRGGLYIIFLKIMKKNQTFKGAEMT